MSSLPLKLIPLSCSSFKMIIQIPIIWSKAMRRINWQFIGKIQKPSSATLTTRLQSLHRVYQSMTVDGQVVLFLYSWPRSVPTIEHTYPADAMTDKRRIEGIFFNQREWMEYEKNSIANFRVFVRQRITNIIERKSSRSSSSNEDRVLVLYKSNFWSFEF